MPLRDVSLVNASVPESATIAEAAATLFDARVPALAVLDANGRVVGIFSEDDLLRAVFPGYLGEMRHTAFLSDDASSLDEAVRRARGKTAGELRRPTEVLSIEDSQVHAAERFMHSGDEALPVVDGERFAGMLSIAALCHARLRRVEER